MIYSVFDHKGKCRGYRTWRGAKNAFSMAGWREAKEQGEAAKDAWAENQLAFDRVYEHDVRRLGAVHIGNISIRATHL